VSHQTDPRSPAPPPAVPRRAVRGALFPALTVGVAALLAGSGPPPARAEPPGVVTHLLRLSTGDGKETTGALFLPARPPERPPRAHALP